MKEKLSKKILKYTVIFEPAEEGGYVVSVPALPGCVTEGDTFEEAMEMVKDAISGYIASLQKHGEEVPVESAPSVMSTVDIAYPTP